MCGIVGIVAQGRDVGYDLYEALLTLQHRGQDAAGIATFDGIMHLKKGIGLVRSVFNEKNLARLRGSAGIGQTRYPTIGRGSPEDAQPFYVNYPHGVAMVHNGNVVNFTSAKDELQRIHRRQLNSTSDVEVILNVFADELGHKNSSTFSADDLYEAVAGVFRKVKGAYSVVALLGDGSLLGFRDPHGIRPLVMGRKDGMVAFASETVTFDFLGFEFSCEVEAGEAVHVSTEGKVSHRQISHARKKPCIFEWVYFARPDSVIEGIGVIEARRRLGKVLARKCTKRGITADVVVPVPDTSRPAALALARQAGWKITEGLIRNRYIQRTFIMPSQPKRKSSVRQKFNPVRSELKGKRVLLVDDTIVRGNTALELIKLIRQAGAAEVYYAVYGSPLRFPCVYGIDMATHEEFIAKSHTEKEIEDIIGADRLIYQDFEAMVEAVRGRKDINFCTACFSGDYPTKVSEAEIEIIAADRNLKETQEEADYEE
ncbi:amidophosphoribosyltransferase [candidate division WOR-3 bacterium]|uniref:Amidophosphoribosyltransferase n=1 Tax=candidate division WOR-3 bacterium TaxID=2052148 RepID=A0A9D5K8R6_UNCW3|nr:amidophosphoribosyltransferase [candidate division WOR-3 bacterium]MBD3364194.1 amidophosphoribosyltransferase [candidate division WOR-3 bacterium]